MNRIESLELPNTIATCQDRIQELSAELTAAHVLIEELQGQNRALQEKVRDLMHRLFGKKSERQVNPPISEEREEEPAAAEVVPTVADQDPQTLPPTPTTESPRRARGQQPGAPGHGRQRRPELPERIEYHDVPEEQKRCAECGEWYVAAGTDDSEQIDWQVRVQRVVTRRQRYRKVCSCETSQPSSVTAPPPPNVIPKGLFTVSFVVNAVLMKFLWGLPLHRLVRILAYQGCPVSSGTLVGVLHRVQDLLEPLYHAIRDRNRQEEQWHVDESRWKVFVEKVGKTGYNWWLWVFSGQMTTLFILDPSRSARVPRDHLSVDHEPTSEKGRRTLISDFYVVYRLLGDAIRNAWCWAHIRRKFLEAARSVPDLGPWSTTWVSRIATLYQRYHRRKAASPDSDTWDQADQALRAWVAELKTYWQDELKDPALAPRAAKVLRTVQRQWEGLTLFLDDLRIPLDNNEAERLLRTPVVGRKNYYGSRAQWSGELAAMCWTVWATTAQNGLNPQAFFTAYLTACAENGGQPLEEKALERFLPWTLSDTDRAAWAAPGMATA